MAPFTANSFLGSSLALYSTCELDGARLLVGGWYDSADFTRPASTVVPYVVVCDANGANCSRDYSRQVRVTGQDRLYTLDRTTRTFSPLRFTDGQLGLRDGYHLNDPSLVRPISSNGVDRSSWWLVYLTCLPDQYFQYPESAEHNRVCLITSSDNAKTWSFLGELIGDDNHFNHGGAWSPSAIVVGNEIWVYSTTQSFQNLAVVRPPQLIRTRFAADGVSFLGVDAVAFTAGLPVLTNVDVKYANGMFYMVGNTLDGTPSGFYDFSLYVSTDGIHFRNWAAPGQRLVNAGQAQLLTPELDPTAISDQFHLRFAQASAGNDYLFEWTIRLQR